MSEIDERNSPIAKLLRQYGVAGCSCGRLWQDMPPGERERFGDRFTGPSGLVLELQRLRRLGIVENGTPAPCPMQPHSNEKFTTWRLAIDA